MTTFPRDILPGTVIQITNLSGTTSYTATDYAAKGDCRVSAKRRNGAMPSGWECADILLFPTDSVEII